jgi:putative acetyltransferase
VASVNSPLAPVVREQHPDDADAVCSVIARAFADDALVAPLDTDLANLPGTSAFVAEVAGEVVGHVRLTWCWIDAEDALIDTLVLSPLSVDPSAQRTGVGRALVTRSLARAEEMGSRAVFLEGDPAYYTRLSFRPAAELGVTPPASRRVPAAAFQAVRFATFEPWVSGALVYPDAFWRHDAVGLRGETLAAARAELGD